MEKHTIKLPMWYWILTVIFLLWNLMGVLSFFSHTFITEEALNELPKNQQDLYKSYPFWTTIVFAIAVSTGFLGSLGLLMKMKWSKLFFLVSLSAIIPQMIHNVFFTNSMEVYGIAQATTMPTLVVLIGIFLIWFSDYAAKKNWLN